MTVRDDSRSQLADPIYDHVSSPTIGAEVPEAEALFKEARRRRRRRWAGAAGGLTLVLATIVGVDLGRSNSGGSPSSSTVSTVPHVGAADDQVQRTAIANSTWKLSAALYGISCVASHCVAVGFSGGPQGIEGLGPQLGSGASFTFNGTARVLVSTDGGARWETGALPPGIAGLSSVACPTATNCLAVGDGSPASTGSSLPAVLSSTDGGLDWMTEAVSTRTAPLSSIACSSSASCVAVGGRSGVPATDTVALFTTNGGRLWAPSAVPHGVAVLTSVACTRDGRCMAIGQNTDQEALVLVSSDGGATWRTATGSIPLPGETPSAAPTPVPAPYETTTTIPNGLPAAEGWLLQAVTCVGGGRCLVIGLSTLSAGGSSALFVTNDDGVTWQAATGWNQGLGGSQWASISCPSAITCIADVGPEQEPGELQISSDGGLSWQPVPSAAAPQIATVALTCPAATACVAVGTGVVGHYWMSAASSSDPETTWRRSLLPDPVAQVTEVSCWNAVDCLAVGANDGGDGAALFTSDAGKRWAVDELPLGTPPLSAIQCPTPGTCVALAVGLLGTATNGSFGSTVLLTKDGGQTWTSEPTPWPAVVQSVACETATTCWEVGQTQRYNGFSSSAFAAVTTDDGRSWQSIVGSPGAPPAAEVDSALGGISYLDDVACPSPTSCLALSAPGPDPNSGVVQLELVGGAPHATVLATLPTGWAPAFNENTTGNGYPVSYALTCTSAQRCLLAGSEFKNPGSEDGKGQILETVDAGSDWHVVENSKIRGGVSSVACPSTSLCVAVLNAPLHRNQKASVIATFDGMRMWSVQRTPKGIADLDTVWCTDASGCLAVGTVRDGTSSESSGPGIILFSTNGGRAWKSADIPTLPPAVTG